MKTKQIRILLLILLVGVMAACTLTPTPTPNPTEQMATAIALIQTATAQAILAASPTPTSTPTPTRTLTPTPTRTPTPTPTPTKTPTPLPLVPYTNPVLGFAISYPRGWETEETENVVTFTSPDSTGFVMVSKRSRRSGLSTDFYIKAFLVMLETDTDYENLQVIRTSTEVINGVEWEYWEIACTNKGVPFTITVFAAGWEDTLYMVFGVTSNMFFGHYQKIFWAMVKNFRLLSR